MSQPSAKEIAEKILDYFERGNDMAYEANAMMFGHQLAEAYLEQQKRIERLEKIVEIAKLARPLICPCSACKKFEEALIELDKDAT